jgi:hypothetical protein
MSSFVHEGPPVAGVGWSVPRQEVAVSHGTWEARPMSNRLAAGCPTPGPSRHLIVMRITNSLRS